MSYFVRSPEDQREEAMRRAKVAQNLLDAAEKAYKRDACRANLISLKAAVRLCRESNAQAKEWFDD